MNSCPQCNQLLADPLSCRLCGWQQAKTGGEGNYPTIQQVHSIVAGEILRSKKPRHPQMPREIEAATQWLMRLIDKPSMSEKPQKWIWPYLSRCRSQAERFMGASRGHQDLIIACMEDGIRWHGESEEQLAALIAEFELMREIGVTAFRARLKHIVHNLADKFRVNTPQPGNEARRAASIARAQSDEERAAIQWECA